MATYVLSPEQTRALAKHPDRFKKLLKAAENNQIRLWTSAAAILEAARRGVDVANLPSIVGIDPITKPEWTGDDVIWSAVLVAAKRVKAEAIIVKDIVKDPVPGNVFPAITLKEALEIKPVDAVPMLDFKAPLPEVYAPIMHSLNETFANTAYVCGAKVKLFEQAFAKACGAKYCFGVSSGTDSLHLALMVLGIQPGDEVITTPFTFFATVEAIEMCNAKTVFVDIDPKTFTLDPKKLRKAITPKTKAIIPIHLYGQSCDMAAIMKIADEFKIPVIEDCAQAHLAAEGERVVGSIGTLGCFSFYPTKNLGAWGEGGAVTTNDPDIANRIEWIRNHGQREKYKHDIVGHNYRMEEIQGAVLGEKVKHLEHWTQLRETAAKRYTKGLKGIGDIKTPFIKPGNRHVWHLYTIRTSRRDELDKYLTDNKIGHAIHYPIPLHLQPAWRDKGYADGDFPESEKAGKEVISLPMFAEISPEQQARTIEVIRQFYEK